MAKKKKTYFFRGFDGNLLVFGKLRKVKSIPHSYSLRPRKANEIPGPHDTIFEPDQCVFSRSYCSFSSSINKKAVFICSRKAFYEAAEKNYKTSPSVPPRLIGSVSDFLDAIKLSKNTGVSQRNSLFFIEYLAERRKPHDEFFTAGTSSDPYFYRGVTNCIYPEMAGIFRKNLALPEDVFYRESLVKEPSAFSGKKAIEILTEMQHFELPTRLLDVSSNPLVALYMACSPLYCSASEWEVTDGEVIAYKAGRKKILYSDSDKAKLLACLPLLGDEDKSLLFQAINANQTKTTPFINVLEKLVGFVRQWDPAFQNRVNPSDLLQSYFVKSPLINSRIAAQQGAFILQGLDPSYIAHSFLSTRSTGGERLIIPARKKRSILGELSNLGINDSTMFPDLEHTARFLRSKRF